MKKTYKSFYATFAMIFCIGHVGAQNASDLDVTFGNNGMVVTDIAGDNDWVYALAQQTDNKIIAVGIINSGDLVASRYLSDGTVDVSFGTAGFTTIATNVSSSSYADVVIQPDGKIVLSGTYRNGSDHDFGIFRLTSSGILDVTFGVGGMQTTNIGNTNDRATGLVLQPDGKLIVAGQTSTGSPATTNAALVRYTSNGMLDNSFGTGGILIHDISPSAEDLIIDLALRPDGKIVGAGTSTSSNFADYTVVQYNSDGSLDNSFGTNGVVAIDHNNRPNNCKAINLQSDGRILLTGDHSSTTSYDYMTVRLNTDGSLDNSFGGTGIVISQFSSSSHNERGWDILEQPGGKIVIAGEYRDWANVVRYNADGTLDAAFGTGGNQTLDITPGDYDKARAILLQTDGKILVGGNTFNADNDFMLARFYGDGASVSIVENTHLEVELSVYPSPANDVIMVSGIPENSTLTLVNAHGKVMYQAEVNAPETTISTSQLDAGMYILRLKSEYYMISKRLMICR